MSKRVGGPEREHGPFFNFPLRFLRSRLAVLPDSLRLYGTCDIRGLRRAAPTSRGAWGKVEADAAGVKKQHFLRDRFEAKPGDVKLIVCRVIKGTLPITKPSLAKAEDRLSAIKCSG